MISVLSAVMLLVTIVRIMLFRLVQSEGLDPLICHGATHVNTLQGRSCLDMRPHII